MTSARVPTPHELLIEAMAATAWETMQDEGQWTGAIECSLIVAKRDHLPALLEYLGVMDMYWDIQGEG